MVHGEFHGQVLIRGSVVVKRSDSVLTALVSTLEWTETWETFEPAVEL